MGAALLFYCLRNTPVKLRVPYHSSAFTLVTIASSIAGTILLTTLGRQRIARRNQARFEALAEAIPQIIWIADSTGKTTYINKRWYQMTGTSEDEEFGDGWIEAVHPDDRGPLDEKWQGCMRTGETFEIEYRLHDAAKGYRWYLDRAVPLRDEHGVIHQWFGTCTDIEEQKLYQQTLEQQIKERTEELADANTRLQHEMWERDLARKTLDEQNEKMMTALKKRTQRATLLAEMGELLQSCLTREEVFTAALGFAPRIFPNRRGAIVLFNSAGNLVEVAGNWNDCQLPANAFEAESCWALRTGHPHLVRAGDTTACCGHASGVTSTYVCIPILAQGEALGILHIRPPTRTQISTKPTCPSRQLSLHKSASRLQISVCATPCAHSPPRIHSPAFITVAIWKKCSIARFAARSVLSNIWAF